MTGALASDPYILGISLGSIFVTDIKEHIVYVDRYKGTHSLCSHGNTGNEQSHLCSRLLNLLTTQRQITM